MEENPHEKNKRMTNMALEEKKDRFSKLPRDISLDISSRLPLKTISNCRWVSKTWYSFILHPNLPKIHFTRFKHTLPCAIFHSHYQGTTLIDPTMTAYHFYLKEFYQNFIASFEVVGIANGMICFSPDRRDYDLNPYYICNPITRDYVLLPRSPKIGIKHIGSGFGFDSINNEYKVVRILINSSRDGNVIEIYTMGSRMWRRIQMNENVPYVEWMFTQSHVFLNGCLHWTPSVNVDSTHHTHDTVILSFDINREEFDMIALPPVRDTRKSWFRYFYLIVLGGCLCVMDVGSSGEGRDVWVMKKYGGHSSWVKEYVFENEYYFRTWQGFHEVLELKNNQLLLLNRKGVPSYYDYEKKTSNKIEILDLERNAVDLEISFPIYFHGSLFSPKAIEGGQQGIRGSTRDRVRGG